MYHYGQGVPQDYPEAVRWYRMAAEQGNANGQFNFGVMYHDGRVVPQDYAEAVRWYRMAAEQGNADAQFNLGYMYRHGQGVPQDFVEAHMWYNLAAARAGNKEGRDWATRNREIVASKMSREQIAEAQKRAREWQPK